MEALAERRRRSAQRLIDHLGHRVRFQHPDAADVVPNPMLVAALFDDMPAVARALLARGVDTKRDYMRDCSALLEAPASFPNASVRSGRCCTCRRIPSSATPSSIASHPPWSRFSTQPADPRSSMRR
jgi:hypothetical protein